MVKPKLYLNGQEIGELPDMNALPQIEVDTDNIDPKFRHRLLGGITKEVQGEIVFKNCKYNRLGFLSLLLGRKITNNWLKMHGGVMCRKGGKRSRC